MRVRVRFAKTGKLRYISAIDLGRVWERALRKADLPISYSEGFSPHPKVSFGDALPLGFASTAEFAELAFGGAIDLAVMTQRLNAVFPTGLQVLDAKVVSEDDRRLGRLLQASLWGLDYASADGLSEAVAALPADGPLLVQRQRKGELVTADLRPPLAGIAVHGAQVRAIVRHPGFIPGHDEGGTEPAGTKTGIAPRADDIHTALGLPRPPHVITRLAQGRVSSTTAGVDDALRDTTEPLLPGDAPPDLAASPQPPATTSEEDAT